MRLSPSIASSNLANIEKEIERIGYQYDSLHIDIEDGNFVKNITFGLKMLEDIRSITDKPFSVHLMVTEPEDYIDELIKLNCSHIFVHGECSMYLKRFFYKIRENNIKAGLALNPISNISDFEYLLNDIDAVLYMTSEVDGYGEKFQPLVLEKIRHFDNIETWIDGGVNFSNIKLLPEQTSYVVIGRGIFNNTKAKEKLEEYF